MLQGLGCLGEFLGFGGGLVGGAGGLPGGLAGGEQGLVEAANALGLPEAGGVETIHAGADSAAAVLDAGEGEGGFFEAFSTFAGAREELIDQAAGLF